MTAFLGSSSFVPDTGASTNAFSSSPVCHPNSAAHRGRAMTMAGRDRHLSNAGMFHDFASSVFAAASAQTGSIKPVPDFSFPPDTPRVSVAYKVRLAEVRPISPSGDTLQLSVDLSSRKQLHSTHTRPGQFIQLSLPGKPRCPPCNLVIASPPASGDEKFLSFDFVVPTKSRRFEWLSSLSPGASLNISRVMGDGLEMPQAGSNMLDHLLLFADSPQGIAAVRSFVEWTVFRAASCSGTVCRTNVVLYHITPSPASLAYTHLHGMWQVYGVTVVPMFSKGMNITAALKSVQLSKTGLLREAQAILCLRTRACADAALTVLSHYALPHETVQYLDADTMDADLKAVNAVGEDGLNSGDGSREKDLEDAARQQFEEEVWTMWSAIRDGFRADYESKWQAKAASKQTSEREEKEKSEAWDKWIAENEQVWQEVRFDGNTWNEYWESWGGPSSSQGQSKTNWASPGGNYSSSKSKEYWDYTGRGNRSTSSRSYSSQDYSSTGSAGPRGKSSSSYQGGGYRYEWDGGPGSNQAGNNADWSNWSGKKAHNYSSSSGQGRRSGYGRSTGGYGAGGGGVGRNAPNMDFYGILGVTPGAGQSEIKKAYRSMAKKFHPDLNRGREAEVMDKMKNVVLAYSVLKDDSKRGRYDQHGSSGL